MAKFFVGQRVRLIVNGVTVPVGTEGVVVEFHYYPEGTIANNGSPLKYASDCVVNYIGYGARSSSTSLIEPILPEGAAPSTYSYQELLDKLREGERV